MPLAEFQSIPHSFTWHFTVPLHLHSACCSAQTQTTEGCVSDMHTYAPVPRTVYTHTQMQTRIDERICCINTTNMLTGIHKYTLAERHARWCLSGRSCGALWLSQAETHALISSYGRSHWPPVRWWSLTATSLPYKQTAVVWNMSRCRSLLWTSYLIFIL